MIARTFCPVSAHAAVLLALGAGPADVEGLETYLASLGCHLSRSTLHGAMSSLATSGVVSGAPARGPRGKSRDVWRLTPEGEASAGRVRGVLLALCDVGPPPPRGEEISLLASVLDVLDRGADFRCGPKGAHLELRERIRAAVAQAAAAPAIAPTLPPGWRLRPGLGERMYLTLPVGAARGVRERARAAGVNVGAPRPHASDPGRVMLEVMPGDVARLLPDRRGEAGHVAADEVSGHEPRERRRPQRSP